MITLKNLLKYKNINITIPPKLGEMELYIDEHTCKYEKRTENKQTIHTFSGKIEDIDLQITVEYNETTQELSITSDRHYNAYDKNGKHIIMS